MQAHKIVLGTVQFGLNYGINNQLGQPSFESVSEILEYANERLIVELDTAQAYGASEELIGKYLKTHPSQFKIQSKFTVDSSEFSFEKNLSRSLENLGLNSIEGIYFHKYSDFKNCSYFDEIEKSKKRGLFKKLGVSIYSSEELAESIQHPAIDMIQIPFNILDRDEEKVSLLKMARKNGKQTYCRSVFLQGLLLKKPNSLPEKLKTFSKTLTDLESIATKVGLSIPRLCLGYVLQCKFIDRVIIGVDSLAQLEMNLKYADNSDWSIEAFNQIENELSRLNIEDRKLLNPANW